MEHQIKMPIREFSRLSGIRRENLRFYDQIGLLSPESRGDNGYRYYSKRQLNQAFLICDLRALGLGLEEIKSYAEQRSPEKMRELFMAQDGRIEKEIERLRSIQELMKLRAEMVRQAVLHEKETFFLEEKEREAIYLCPARSEGGTDEEGFAQSYEYAKERGVDISFPVGSVIAAPVLETENLPPVYCNYFKVSKHSNAWKPAGTYAVYYGRYSDDFPETLYRHFGDLIREKGFRIDGYVYEEYPLDELSTNDGGLYGVRVEARVSG